MIRPAVKEDAEKLSELMFMIWHDMELPLVVQNDKETVLRLLEQASVESEYRNHYKHSQVYEVDGEVAGFLNCYSGTDEKQLEENWYNIAFKDSFKLEGTPLPEHEADNGDLYIDSVAVFSEYRGRGIASKLIEDAIERAKERGFKQVSLNCEFDNEGAMKLYEKLGFKPSYVRKLSGHDYKYMIKHL
ncbi:MAG TPA: GNAT family N-acetyltransferase [Staphylococcus sp.]|nr:GNAT family N-acetyltransferase [Staphylococcus sp.]